MANSHEKLWLSPWLWLYNNSLTGYGYIIYIYSYGFSWDLGLTIVGVNSPESYAMENSGFCWVHFVFLVAKKTSERWSFFGANNRKHWTISWMIFDDVWFLMIFVPDSCWKVWFCWELCEVYVNLSSGWPGFWLVSVAAGLVDLQRCQKKPIWLVVWNIFFMTFHINWEFHNPNWRTQFFQRGRRETANQLLYTHGVNPTGGQRADFLWSSEANPRLSLGAIAAWCRSGLEVLVDLADGLGGLTLDVLFQKDDWADHFILWWLFFARICKCWRCFEMFFWENKNH